MRRHVGGTGCGARGPASQAGAREVPGPDPLGTTTLLRGARWTGRLRAGALAEVRSGVEPARRGPMTSIGRVPGSADPGSEIAAAWRAERRRTLATRCALKDWQRRPARHPLAVLRGSTPPNPLFGARERQAYPAPRRKNAGDDACLVAIWRNLGALAVTLPAFSRFPPLSGIRIPLGRMLRIKAIVRCVGAVFLAISARFSGRGEAPSKRPSSTSLAPGGGVVFRQRQFNRG